MSVNLPTGAQKSEWGKGQQPYIYTYIHLVCYIKLRVVHRRVCVYNSFVWPCFTISQIYILYILQSKELNYFFSNKYRCIDHRFRVHYFCSIHNFAAGHHVYLPQHAGWLQWHKYPTSYILYLQRHRQRPFPQLAGLSEKC